MIFVNRFVNKRFFTNKSYQDAIEKNFSRHFNSSRYFFSFFKQNSIYINNSQNRISNNCLSNFEVIIKIEDQKKNERDFDRDKIKSYDKNKKNRNKNHRNDKSRNKNRKNKYRDKKKFKIKTYVAQKNEDHENNNHEGDYENYHHSKNLTYFDLDCEKSDDFENTILINNIISNNIHFRRCQAIFNSNNLFHKYLRSNN